MDRPLLYFLQASIFMIFVISGFGKALTGDALRTALAVTGFSESLIGLVRVTLPLLELGLAVAIVFGTPDSRRIAMAGAVLLLSVFAVWMITLAIRGRTVSCACFGSKSQAVGWQTVIRNILLIAFSAYALHLEQKGAPGLPMTTAGVTIVFGLVSLLALGVGFQYGRSGMTFSRARSLLASDGKSL